MEVLEFYRIRFDHKHETIFVAIEEIHYTNYIEIKGVYLFKNPSGEVGHVLPPFRQNITDLDSKEMIQKQKEVIKNVAISEFEKSYGETFHKDNNKSKVVEIDGSRFFPLGFEQSIYDDIIKKIQSKNLKEIFQQMKKIPYEDKPGKLMQ